MLDLRREPGRTRPLTPLTLLLFLLSLPVLQAACASAAPPATPSPSPLPSRPEPPSPTYQTLDGRFHYYAVTRLEEIADHFFVTFHDAEGAYCTVARAPGRPVVVEGCGFPATGMPADAVPDDRAFLLPSIRDAVRRQEPRAANIRVRFEGAYRSVHLEEEMPCNGAHGQGYNQVELRFDERLEKLHEVRYLQGSGCGAAPFYWASPSPRWLSFTSTRTLLGLTDAHAPLPADLARSLAELLANPGAGTLPPAVP
jgi:hypothetical protein